MFLRVGLRRPQRVGPHHVELDVVAVQLEVRADERCQLVDAFLPLEQLRRELLVEQRPAAARVIHVRGRLDDRGRSVAIGAVRGRDAVGHRSIRLAAVRRRAGHRSEVHMAGRREVVDVVRGAFRRAAAVDGIEQQVAERVNQRVRALIVVAVLGRLVEEQLPERFVAVEVGGERLEQLRHGESRAEALLHRRVVGQAFRRAVGQAFRPASSEDMLADRRKAVGDRRRADRHDVGRVVARAAGVVVLPVLDAVRDEDREERRGHQRRVEALDDVAAAHLHVDEVAHLTAVRLEQIVEGPERPSASGLDADLLSGARIDAVVERDLEDLREVEVAGQDVGFLAERPRLDAAARPAGPCVLERLAMAHQFVHHHVGVEDRRLAPTLADDLAAAFQEAIRTAPAQLQVR